MNDLLTNVIILQTNDGSQKEKFLKTYGEGEVFGELALLYNAPRAASIQAKTDSLLYGLNRETFNSIVRESAIRRKGNYEVFLKSVPLLENMDSDEIS